VTLDWDVLVIDSLSKRLVTDEFTGLPKRPRRDGGLITIGCCYA
jgi:hypothetical protein